MILVGLTGGIGVGKSTVAAMFAACGAAVVDADRISRAASGARRAVLPSDRRGIRARRFWTRRSDRPRRLGAMVFADPARRTALEAIMHPAIWAACESRDPRGGGSGAGGMRGRGGPDPGDGTAEPIPAHRRGDRTDGRPGRAPGAGPRPHGGGGAPAAGGAVAERGQGAPGRSRHRQRWGSGGDRAAGRPGVRGAHTLTGATRIRIQRGRDRRGFVSDGSIGCAAAEATHGVMVSYWGRNSIRDGAPACSRPEVRDSWRTENL